MNNTEVKQAITWPCEWYANGEYQPDVSIRLTDKQINAITDTMVAWSKQNEQ